MRSSKSDPRPSKAIEFSDLCGKRTTDLVTGLVGLSGCDLSPWGSSFSARALLFSSKSAFRRSRAVHHFSESKNGVKLALNHKFRSQPRFQENETRSRASETFTRNEPAP